jgi:hypothetical protein
MMFYRILWRFILWMCAFTSVDCLDLKLSIGILYLPALFSA